MCQKVSIFSLRGQFKPLKQLFESLKMDWSVEIPRNMNIKSLDEKYEKLNLFLCNNVLRMSIAEFMSLNFKLQGTFHSIFTLKDMT